MSTLSYLAKAGRRALATAGEPGRFSRRQILRSEFIYGYGFQAPGGVKTTVDYAAGLNLPRGAVVADIGCGPGGATFHMAQFHGAHATGVDRAMDMIKLGQERALTWDSGSEGTAKFQLGSMDDINLFEKGSLDLVWSRDAIMYVDNETKDKSFACWYDWLKPGGKLFITDFGKGENSSSEHKAYVEKSAQYQETLAQSQARYEKAGFHIGIAEDISSMFTALNISDLESFRSRRAEFEDEYSAGEFAELESRWIGKINSTREGSQKQFCFIGHKPG